MQNEECRMQNDRCRTGGMYMEIQETIFPDPVLLVFTHSEF